MCKGVALLCSDGSAPHSFLSFTPPSLPAMSVRSVELSCYFGICEKIIV